MVLDRCYTYGYECNGGSYTIDNGYCQEVEVVECSSLDENSCNHPLYGEGCNWVEDITEGSCYYGFNNYSDCIANGCYWYNPGTYGYMGSHCYGGSYTIDNSYCEEIENQQGDLNGDSSVDVLDVIQTIDRPKILDKLKFVCEKTNKTPKFFIQVNTGEEPQKSGVKPDELKALLEYSIQEKMP